MRSRLRCRASTSCWSSAATPPPSSWPTTAATADLDWAASRIATFANYQAGQSCISVQRVLVDRSVFDVLVAKVVEKVQALRDR